ncbi:VOC family protein [Streptomyces sp. NPDC090022]|uniref:VOC family protein n=1 Tax=Streptomyces sp. NPDC090022 TaxID=3365920 RepID=UPI00380D72DB
MALRPVHVNVKALDGRAVGRFWGEALGWSVFRPGATTYVGPSEDLVRPDPVVLGIDVVPVPERKTRGKNCTHLDLATTSEAHRAELAARLRALGARPVDVGQGDVPWTSLVDPEGHEFCILALS